MPTNINFRIGNGYDVHRLTEGRPLILGGVNIPFEKGLLGHSDADVLIHAVIDALLGACAKGDIGRMFPDDDPDYLSISSMVLLRRVMNILHEEGYAVINVDCTIVAQRPKLKDYIPEMVSNIGQILGVSSQCNVKAKTEEGLGFTGTEQGISAYAVCLICRQ